MFSLFMHHFAAVAEPMIPAEEPDITKIDSIEDGFGFFRTLGHNSAEWFQREQQNLFAMAIGIGVTLVTVFLVRWFFRAVLLRITRKLPSELPTHIVEQLGARSRSCCCSSGCRPAITWCIFPARRRVAFEGILRLFHSRVPLGNIPHHRGGGYSRPAETAQ